MLRWIRFAKYALLGSDVVVFILSYHIGHLIRKGYLYPEILVPGTLWFLPATIAVFLVLDVYNPWSHATRLGLATRTIQASAVVALILTLEAYLLFGHELDSYVGRSVLYIAVAIFGLYATTARFAFAQLFDQSRMSYRWLILTEKRFLGPIHKEIQRRFPMWDIVYLVRDSGKVIRSDDGVVGHPMKSGFASALKERWDGVVIATESLSNAQLETLLARRLGGLPVLDLVSFYERFFLKVPLYFMEHSHLMIGRGFFVLSNVIGHRLKYVMDYSIAIVLLVLTFPVMLLVILVVWLDSGRPVFFRQERTGLNGETFDVFKFRTMVMGADRLDPYTQPGDNRITRVGRFLRVTRLDELPQLFNVLKGQMSLIGPRAEWTRLTREYERQIPFYNLRHLVRPGITGWAQVMYPYGANIEDTIHKLEYDLYYIKNYTALLDINILLKTVRVVLFRGGR